MATSECGGEMSDSRTGERSPSGGRCLTQQAGRSQSHASDCLLEAPADADAFGVPAEESVREASRGVLSQELIFAQEGGLECSVWITETDLGLKANQRRGQCTMKSGTVKVTQRQHGRPMQYGSGARLHLGCDDYFDPRATRSVGRNDIDRVWPPQSGLHEITWTLEL
ncbi:hypothetical protein EYF80_002984 [Liparis tanakae]|uniref:Uncharacterized protein n=1 Tax=Liparis tanakae TaxID=230148 RepID=A0A4Z2JA40_9TELE|nr:hypothetical protein EYF80_002984 [Liparis tanakae]